VPHPAPRRQIFCTLRGEYDFEYPPRMTGSLLSSFDKKPPELTGTRQAMPTLGAKLFLSVAYVPRGTPGSPGYTRPAGADGKRTDCTPGWKAFSASFASTNGFDSS